MKLVILAGGLGTRFSEETMTKPKPMITILNKPIIWFIMKHYSYYGIKDFIICGGYKINYIKKYFQSNSLTHKSIYINKRKVGWNFFYKKEEWNINLINTGLKTMTGGRINKIKKLLQKEDIFCLTYGDGISDVNINQLIKFHKKNKTEATILAVKPPPRFGSLEISGNKVINFSEKNINLESYINGGFFVLSNKILKLINKSSDIFEHTPLKTLAKNKQLSSFVYKGLWMAMDTLRDKINIEKYMKSKNKSKIWL
jgi:glucose-1-phosphate cytidylyltransferase